MSVPVPNWTNLGFELGWTGLGLGLRGLRTKGLGPGLGLIQSGIFLEHKCCS